MKKLIIEVPPSQSSQDWFDFINSSLEKNFRVDELVVDFNTVQFMDTDDFVVLACLIESFFIDGATVHFAGGTEGFNNHLNNIKFKEYWKEGFDRNKFTLSLNNTTLCLWKISQTMIYSYSSYAKEYFNRFDRSKDLIPLASNLDEVFNNVFDHSKSEVTGYIITQFYQKSNKLSFSICDFGVGIPSSIKEYDPKVKEDWKALVMSLEKGYSAKSTPRNRGFGLNNILEFTEGFNGKLSIISNNGVLEKEATEFYKVGKTDYNFQGTLIKVEVDLETFDQKEESQALFEF